MENIEINGDFITIRETTFNLTDLISIKPQSIVTYWIPKYGNGLPKETGRDFPKIIVQTKNERLEFAYNTEEERDEALRELNEKIKMNQASKSTKLEAPGNISINIADSSNVNIVHQSSSINITNQQIDDAKNIIRQIKEELNNAIEDQVQADEILESLADIELKIEKKERIPRLTFKSFLETSSNIASIASLAINLGQIIGMLPLPK